MKKAFLLLFGFSLILTSCFSPSNEQEEKEQEEKLAKQEEEREEKKKDKDNSINISFGEDSKIEIDGESMEKLEEGLEKMADAFKDININVETDVESVDFRKLKKELPSSIGWMKRTSFEGERAGVLGIKTSVATATYESGTKEIKISIVDIGGFKSALRGLAIWSELEVDKESDHGYERTTEIEGYKAFEKYDSRKEDGEIALIIEDRIVVTIEGENIDEDDLRKALKKIDLDDLEDLTDE
jgi:hypothetical protein